MSSSKIIKTKKVYEIDGVMYKSSASLKYHKEFKEAIQNNLIKSFVLPDKKSTEEKSKSKYKNNKVIIDEKIFDSIMEARFYIYLLKLQKDNIIKTIERQVVFTLQEGYYNSFKQKKIYPITYKADFVIELLNDIKIVIDVKGMKTVDFKIKEKMLGYKYPDLCFMCVKWYKANWETLEDIEKDKKTKKNTKK